MKEEILKKLNMFISTERKVEFLEKMLEKPLDKETKIFVCLLLSSLYEKKGFYNHAVKYLINAEQNTEKYIEKIPLLMKISKTYIKLFDFVNAEDYFRQAINIASSSNAEVLKKQYYNFYLEEARFYEGKKFYKKAIRFYEYLANNNFFKLQMLEKMAELYDRAAMPLEAGKIKRLIFSIIGKEKEKIERIKKEREEQSKKAEWLV